MKNLILRDGFELSLPVPAGTKSGEIVKSGGYIGVAVTDRADLTPNPTTGLPTNLGGGNPTGRASVWLNGVIEVQCAEAVTAEGTDLYITGITDTHTGTVTTTSSGNTRVGKSTAVIKSGNPVGGTKSAGAGTIYVNLNR